MVQNVGFDFKSGTIVRSSALHATLSNVSGIFLVSEPGIPGRGNFCSSRFARLAILSTNQTLPAVRFYVPMKPRDGIL